MDLDEKKRPLETPRLPDWALPKRQQRGGRNSANGKRQANGQQQTGTNGAARNGRGGLYRDELLGQVRTLCGTVGFSLAKGGAAGCSAKVEDPSKIRDIAKLTAAFEKLQDMARGVERLRSAVTKAGDQRYSAVCRELNLASESIDDIPDRTVLRRLRGNARRRESSHAILERHEQQRCRKRKPERCGELERVAGPAASRGEPRVECDRTAACRRDSARRRREHSTLPT